MAATIASYHVHVVNMQCPLTADVNLRAAEFDVYVQN